MTKKHFIRATEIIKNIEDDEQRQLLARNFADLFQEFNSRFKRQVFLDACEPDER